MRNHLERLSVEELIPLLVKKNPLIDVRAPIEFQQGHLPGALNLPLLNDLERANVGTCYKQNGQEAAIRLGHELVSGNIKLERLESWKNFIKQNPESIIYCFRGGLRSQTVQKWLSEEGHSLRLLQGGYKKARQKLMEHTDRYCLTNRFIVVSGRTGSHKTHFLEKLETFYPTVDLEKLAHHRGSAFGGFKTPQPTQVDFENQLSLSLFNNQLKSQNKNCLFAIEDESRMIGKIVQPESLFNSLRSSDLVYLEETLENRIQNILIDYVKTPLDSAFNEASIQSIFEDFRKAIKNISKKLGGLHSDEIQKSLHQSEEIFLKTKDIEPNRHWIQLLLIYYYDPLYETSLERRQPKIIFRGNAKSMLDFFKNF